MNETFAGQWEQRWHPLRREWIVYSAHRNTRPWKGMGVDRSQDSPAYDPGCYLCPGNKRAQGKRNPKYSGVYIFDNDFPVVGETAPYVSSQVPHGHPALFKKSRAYGIARVVCYDPRHNVTLAQIDSDKVADVFIHWREQMAEFRKTPGIHFVLIFENRGELVGVSNPHPHSQIYATNFPFSLVGNALRAGEEFKQEYGKNLFDEILAFEQNTGVRIIADNAHACAFVPFFARYAYEVMIFPKKRHATLITMNEDELYDLAVVFQEVIQRYDALYGMPFPYVMSFLQAPVDGGDYGDYHFHMLLQPPLRAPGLKKFLAGPEIGGGNFMADTMPEEKARELQQVNIQPIKEEF
ncbi:galactose-1-phosphate uridylyltransferase [bacterium]|nr:galactose-1-phosphate uridylyltransferase [bacterium]